jgi:hypothetical protein
MAGHPDLAEMRERYERVAATRPVAIADGLMLLAGLWLAISPFVIHFNSSAPQVAISNLILGLAVAAVALGLGVAPLRMGRLGLATCVIGIWVVVSQWVIQRGAVDTGIVLNNVITGGLIALLGLSAAGMVMAANRPRAARGG